VFKIPSILYCCCSCHSFHLLCLSHLLSLLFPDCGWCLPQPFNASVGQCVAGTSLGPFAGTLPWLFFVCCLFGACCCLLCSLCFMPFIRFCCVVLRCVCLVVCLFICCLFFVSCRLLFISFIIIINYFLFSLFSLISSCFSYSCVLVSSHPFQIA
jgi:hypothetical protein